MLDLGGLLRAQLRLVVVEQNGLLIGVRTTGTAAQLLELTLPLGKLIRIRWSQMLGREFIVTCHDAPSPGMLRSARIPLPGGARMRHVRRCCRMRAEANRASCAEQGAYPYLSKRFQNWNQTPACQEV